jgi:hypothetical protein
MPMCLPSIAATSEFELITARLASIPQRRCRKYKRGWNQCPVRCTLGPSLVDGQIPHTPCRRRKPRDPQDHGFLPQRRDPRHVWCWSMPLGDHLHIVKNLRVGRVSPHRVLVPGRRLTSQPELSHPNGIIGHSRLPRRGLVAPVELPQRYHLRPSRCLSLRGRRRQQACPQGHHRIGRDDYACRFWGVGERRRASQCRVLLTPRGIGAFRLGSITLRRRQ